MKRPGDAALASVIIPCWNQRGFTELCIRSLMRHTRPPWELIVIDNGSTDDTAAYLAGVRDAAAVPVTIIAILHAELAERPNDPFVLFNLGAIAIEREQWQAALDYLRQSLKGSAPTDSITRKLFALIARSQQMLGDTQAALAACREGLSFDPNDAELWFRKAVLHHQRQEYPQAEASWRRILGLKRPDQFCSVDQGIYGHLTYRNLATLAAARGDNAEAIQLWKKVLEDCPGDQEAEKHLAAMAVRSEGYATV